MDSETNPIQSNPIQSNPILLLPVGKPAQEGAKKHNFWAKVGIALGVSTIGAKLGFLGTIPDASNLLKDEPTLGEKLKTAINLKKLKGKINGQIARDMQEIGSEFNASNLLKTVIVPLKALKYTMILSTVGMVAGGVLGWVRGDKIKNSGDAIKHPITSMKLVLGLQKEAPEKSGLDRPTNTLDGNTSTKEVKWVEKTQQSTQAAGSEGFVR